jgi:hypothetical protein
MKNFAKKCEFCGKPNNRNTKYCTRKCKIQALHLKQEENSQRCWTCANATGGCSWSHCLVPVDGWKAEPVIVKDSEGDIYTYNILSCPKYIRG